MGRQASVDKTGFGSRLNDLGEVNVCAKAHEQMGARLWVSMDNFRFQKPSKFYPQVLNRFPHMLVSFVFTGLKLFGVVNLLNFPELKKSLVISHALHSHLMTFVSRILPSQGQPNRSENPRRKLSPLKKHFRPATHEVGVGFRSLQGGRDQQWVRRRQRERTPFNRTVDRVTRGLQERSRRGPDKVG